MWFLAWRMRASFFLKCLGQYLQVKSRSRYYPCFSSPLSLPNFLWHTPHWKRSSFCVSGFGPFSWQLGLLYVIFDDFGPIFPLSACLKFLIWFRLVLVDAISIFLALRVHFDIAWRFFRISFFRSSSFIAFTGPAYCLYIRSMVFIWTAVLDCVGSPYLSFFGYRIFGAGPCSWNTGYSPDVEGKAMLSSAALSLLTIADGPGHVWCGFIFVVV